MPFLPCSEVPFSFDYRVVVCLVVAVYGSVGASSSFLGLDAVVLLDMMYFLDFCSILMVAHEGNSS